MRVNIGEMAPEKVTCEPIFFLLYLLRFLIR